LTRAKFKAVNNRDKNFTEHKLKARIAQIEESISRYLTELDRADREPALVSEVRVTRLKEKMFGEGRVVCAGIERFPVELTEGRSRYEAQALHRGADHRHPQGPRSGRQGVGCDRQHGISEQSFYRWKSKFGGMEVSEAKRLKEVEAENARLKKLLAEAELDKAMLKDVLSKKW
jgi:putative transposase